MFMRRDSETRQLGWDLMRTLFFFSSFFLVGENIGADGVPGIGGGLLSTWPMGWIGASCGEVGRDDRRMMCSGRPT